MNLSITEAVQQAKVSRATIWRAIKEGNLSVSRTDSGEVRIDASELFRVYEARKKSPQENTVSLETRSDTEIQSLRELIKAHETTIKVQDDSLKELRTRLELSETERRADSAALRALLTNDSQKAKSSSVTPLLVALVTILIVAVAYAVFVQSRAVVSAPAQSSATAPSNNPSSAP